jgi:CelD/BcsL family acetyltransferase involved in cellulose biosynthesis
MIEVMVVDEFKALQKLKNTWSALLEIGPVNSFFLTWEWIETWWECYRSEFELLVLVAAENGVVCGIAPLIIRNHPLKRLEFFGQNKAYGECLDFLIQPGLEKKVTMAFCQRLAELRNDGKWINLHLAVIREDSPNLGLVIRSFADLGINIARSEPRICPVIEFPTTWEDYLANKGGRFRSQVMRAEKRLSQIGDVSLELARNTGEIDNFFDDFVFLHHMRWSKPVDEKFFGFLRQIAHKLYPLNRLILARLRVGETVVAARFDFIYAKKIWNYQGGWRTDFSKLGVGNVCICEEFKYCLDQGIFEYDFLEGDSRFKRHWSTSFYRAFDLSIGEGDTFIL